MLTCGIAYQMLVSFVTYHIFTYDLGFDYAYQILIRFISYLMLECVVNYQRLTFGSTYLMLVSVVTYYIFT